MTRWSILKSRCFGFCLLLILSLGCCSIRAQAQDKPPFRAPTPAERTVINHYKEVLLKLLEAAPNENWEEDVTGNYNIGDNVLVFLSRNQPFAIDSNITRLYQVKYGSPYYQQVMVPFNEKLQSTTDMQAKMDLTAKLERTQVTIEFEINSPSAGYGDEPPKVLHLTVPGAAMAWQIPEDRQKRVTLLFGDWASATRTTDGMRYHFKKAGSYLAIENVAVRLEGNGPRIDELLKTIDWTKVNQALYPAQ